MSFKFLKFKNALYFLLFLFFGLYLFFYHTAVHNFDKMPGDAGDAVVINYVLEHFWLWINQIPQHQSFWNMPFYYPRENTLAYSDIMIGGAIFYVPIRFFIKNPFTSLQIWLAIICFVNYTSFYFLLRKLKYDLLSSSISAFIFAFGIMRYFKMNHLQFYVQYPMIFALVCISFVKQHKHIAFAGFFTFLSLQFWSVYTFGYLFCLSVILFCIISLFFKNTREFISEFLKKYFKLIIFYGLLFIISLIPLAHHYLMLNIIREWDEVLYHFTDLTIWFRNISLLDNIILKYLPVIQEHSETCGGIGLIASLIAAAGLWKYEKYRNQIFISLIFLMMLCVKYGDFSPWYFIYEYLPGANGMRVISRIYFIFLILYCFGIANFFKHIKKKSLLILILLIILIEQIPSSFHTYKWSKSNIQNNIKAASEMIPKGCKVLYVENKYSDVKIDNLAIWVASINNIYSANGSSGVHQPTILLNNAGYCICDFNFEDEVNIYK